MKQYKFDTVQNGRVELFLPISDGHSFIFTLPTSAYMKAKNIELRLYFNAAVKYILTLDPVKGQGSFRGGKCELYQGTLDDRNFVIRVEKIISNSFETHINETLNFTCPSWGDDSLCRIDMGWVAIKTADSAGVTLAVFPYAEHAKATEYSQAMRSADTSVIEIENDEGRALEAREKSLLTDGAASPSSVAPVHPPDADRVKYSSTILWPLAIELEFKKYRTLIQQQHSTLMHDWVVKRRDDLSLSTYDYFVHSHKVAWPKAISSISVEDANKIRERHTQLFVNLP